jgi:hypothetical protein
MKDYIVHIIRVGKNHYDLVTNGVLINSYTDYPGGLLNLEYDANAAFDLIGINAKIIVIDLWWNGGRDYV